MRGLAGVENAGSRGSQARAAVRLLGAYRITVCFPLAHHKGQPSFNGGSLGRRLYGLPHFLATWSGLTETGAGSPSGREEGSRLPPEVWGGTARGAPGRQPAACALGSQQTPKSHVYSE